MVDTCKVVVFLFVFISVLQYGYAAFGSGGLVRQIHVLQNTNCESTWLKTSAIKKFNRTTNILQVNFTSFEDFDDSLILDVELKRWADGGWKDNFIRFQKNSACSIVQNNFPMAFATVFGSLKCPIPKGSYAVENLTVRVKFLVPLGKYRAIMKVKTVNSEIKLCGDVTVQVVEKNDRY